jgi:two-component system chemotaxis sensor kinase CheA
VNTGRYADLFRAESRDRLTEMNSALLAIERGGGAERISELFRAVHSVKGMAAAMGYDAVRDLSHALETLLSKLRQELIYTTPSLMNTLFDAVDALESAITAIGVDPTTVINVSSTIELLEAAAEEITVEDPGVLPTMEWPATRPVLVPSVSSGSFRRTPARPTPARPTPARPTPVRRTPVRATPARATPAWMTPESTTPVRPTPVVGLPLANDPFSDRGPRSIRVDAARLDSLMRLAGELVIARGRLTDLSKKHADQELSEAVLHASRLISDMQREVTTSRMVPVGQAFDRFHRMVRDTAQSLGKRVELEIRGLDIEVDKSVLDELGDPVLHLLRNSLDHGIETAAERRAAGKNPVAKLTLSAEREGSSVLINIADDGRGIDRMAVLARARAAGLVTDAPATLTDSEVFDLIARPGFSTSAHVTQMSGRGVGLDVVASKVRSLGGSVELDTAIGYGTTITLRLPVTLAIIHALLARAGDEVYALPITHVVETVVLTPDMFRMDDGRESLTLRGETLPAVRLRDRLGYARQEGSAGHAVVLELPDKRAALVVDEFMGQQEIVVKRFDAVRGMPPFFSGATILSNGAPALILDTRGVA